MVGTENVNFVAIDFETATTDRMACQVGLTVVRNGTIENTVTRLIQPPGNIYNINERHKQHHISAAMTADKPTFDVVWNEISPLLVGTEIVAHNASFDEDVLMKNLDYYGIMPMGISKFKDTYRIYNHGLEELCYAFSLDCSAHHDAGFDSRCCAIFYLNYLKGIEPDYQLLRKKEKTVTHYRQQLDKSMKEKDLSEADPSNPFFDRRVLVTGDFSMDRPALWRKLKSMGAELHNTLSKRIEIVLIGTDPGPAKMETLEKLIASGNSIKKLYQKDLDHIFAGDWADYQFVKEHLKGADPHHPFYDRHVVLMGSFSNRVTDVRKYLKAVGASIEPKVTKYVNAVLLGADASESDLADLSKLIYNGYNVQVIDVEALNDICAGQRWDEFRTSKNIKKDLHLTYHHFENGHVQFKDGKNVIALKELFFGGGMKGDASFLYQITGNLGALCNWELTNNVDIIVVSDATVKNLMEGNADDTITYIQNVYNHGKSSSFIYRFMSESDILDYCSRRCEEIGDETTLELLRCYMETE